MKKVILPTRQTSELFTKEDIQIIAQYPHVLAHLLGYTDARLFHSEWIHYLWADDDVALKSLMCHRGSYKSSVGIDTGAIWRLLFKPDTTILLVRATFTEAAEGVTNIAKAFKRPEVRELFRFAHGEYPEFKQERLGDGRIDMSFHTKTDRAPSILGLGINSPMTGKHADAIIMDDISNLQSKISKAKRDMDVRVFRELITNIQNRGGFSRYIGTPWTRNGGIEEVLGGFDEAATHKGLAPPKKYHLEDTQLIDEVKLEEIRNSTTPSEFNANYRLVFTSDESSPFSDPIYINEWEYDNIERPRAHIDAAYGGADGTALTIMAQRRDTDEIQVVGFLWQQSVFDVLDEIQHKLKFFKCNKIAVELNTDRGWLVKELKKRAFSVKEYHEGTRKEVKIATFGPELWTKLRFVEPHTDMKYMAQIVDWTPLSKAGEHDDAPDSFASCIREFYSKRAAKQARWQY